MHEMSARLNPWVLSPVSLLGVVLILAIAVASKLVGCGVPAMLVTRSKRVGLRVGIGMISRAEVGLIIAGIGLMAGAIDQDVYAQMVVMAIITTIVTPILLKRSFRNRTERAPA
jgi:Kef-type K+ transport system membrane component KefB